MPDIATISSRTQGHGSFPPTGFMSCSTTLTVDGEGVLCVGDAIIPHTDGESVHGGAVAQGSSVLIVDGKPVAYVGCSTSDGDTIASGKSTVQVSG